MHLTAYNVVLRIPTDWFSRTQYLMLILWDSPWSLFFNASHHFCSLIVLKTRCRVIVSIWAKPFHSVPKCKNNAILANARRMDSWNARKTRAVVSTKEWLMPLDKNSTLPPTLAPSAGTETTFLSMFSSVFLSFFENSWRFLFWLFIKCFSLWP